VIHSFDRFSIPGRRAAGTAMQSASRTILSLWVYVSRLPVLNFCGVIFILSVRTWFRCWLIEFWPYVQHIRAGHVLYDSAKSLHRCTPQPRNHRLPIPLLAKRCKWAQLRSHHDKPKTLDSTESQVQWQTENLGKTRANF
jgi:hypothetical protein